MKEDKIPPTRRPGRLTAKEKARKTMGPLVKNLNANATKEEVEASNTTKGINKNGEKNG